MIIFNTDLSKYKNLFGKLGTGIHSYRIYNIAILDFGVTFIPAYLTHKLFKVNLLVSFIGWIILGIIVHRMFGVRTTVDKLLFPNAK